MKTHLKIILPVLLLSLMALSCKRETLPFGPGVAALNIINVASGTSSMIANINGQLPVYAGQPSVDYGSFALYRVPPGPTSITFRQVSDTTTNWLRTAAMNLANYSIHSLFLAGTVSAPDTLLVTDHLLTFTGHGAADSAAGIRFVNLSTGSAPISINIQGKANGSEVSSLAYKGNSAFTAYPATSTISSYTFEFRDAASGTLLSSYTLFGVNNGSNGIAAINSVLFKNMTLVFSGPPGSQSVILANNF